jgi:DNA-binding transcriptional LysR family regulator
MMAKLPEHSRRFEVYDFDVLFAVAESGSFRKAAAVLDVNQSAVTRRIQKLEEALGVSLFERWQGGTRLTRAGSRFADETREIVSGLDAAIETARSAGIAGTGQLRVGVIASLSQGALRNVVGDFLDDYAQVEVSFGESDRSELLTRLSHRTIDVVVAAGEPPPELGDSLLLDREDIFLAVSADSPYAEKDRLAWADVADAVFIVSAREPGPEIHDYIVRRISDLGRHATVRRHRLGREGIMNLVGLGLGVSLVADHWRGVSYPNVTFVPIGDEGETVPFSITWRPENDNPALRRFLSLARIEAKRKGALSAPPRIRGPSP